jgi:hypothetical protein
MGRRISHQSSIRVRLGLGRRKGSHGVSIPPGRYLSFQACTVWLDTQYRTATSPLGEPSNTSTTARYHLSINHSRSTDSPLADVTASRLRDSPTQCQMSPAFGTSPIA